MKTLVQLEFPFMTLKGIKFPIKLKDDTVIKKRKKYKQCLRCNRKVSKDFDNVYCDNGSCWALDNIS